MAKVELKFLQVEIEELQDRHRNLRDDEAFVAWVLRCFIVDTESEALAALVGGSNDKSLDALHIDESARKVYLLQGKYRDQVNTTESRSDVVAFADLARYFTEEEAFIAYIHKLAPSSVDKARAARERIRNRDYKLQLHFVTTAKVSEALVSEAKGIVRRASATADIEISEGKRVIRLLADYLDGVAPPVPLLELELESGLGVSLSGILQRFDQGTRIESWVVPVSVHQIAQMYETAGIRLFARNVRGFLGDTTINENMRQTLEKEPEFFWYYNNGVTIVCDTAEQISRSGKKVLRLLNPQVINGQQTTRTLHKHADKSSKATVLVRVISVPRETDEESRRFERLVSRIVAATNWQNAIKPSDLMANDRCQVELERNLAKIDYHYLRKRQSKEEARRDAGMRHRFLISKEELAQVSAACDLDPLIVREGKERLFEEPIYDKVFPNSDPEYYLTRYWLARYVSRAAKGYPERAYAKWVVLHFLWQDLSPAIRSRVMKQQFRVRSERELMPSLLRAVDAVFKGCIAYFHKHRGRGATQVDPSTFFKRAGHHREFPRFWEEHVRGYKAAFKKSWKAFVEELQ